MGKLASILSRHAPALKKKNLLSAQQSKVFGSITACRTERLGASVQKICSCGHEIIAYNSCRDRHCPNCQGRTTQTWVAKQSERLLPTKYHHCVFTIPDELCSVVRYNETTLYDLLFHASSKSLKSFFRNDYRFGGKGAFMGILHTWGQRLQLHPHIHYIVACASLTDNGETRTDDSGYLFNVKSMSKVFRGKFLQGLERLFDDGEIRLPPDCKESGFQSMLQTLCRKNWIVYTKESYCGPGKVVEYIGRYAHKVAISEGRILEVSESEVTFQWKDYRKKGTKKEISIEGRKFVRLFAQHVLAPGFHRIRYYGFWTPKGLEKALASLRSIAPACKQALASLLAIASELRRRHEEHGIRCPKCSELVFEAKTPEFGNLIDYLDPG